MNKEFELAIKETANTTRMTVLCGNDHLAVLGALNQDSATKAQTLMMMVVYPDGTVSPLMEYSPSKLTSYKGMMNLLDFQGFISEKEVQAVFQTYKQRLADRSLTTVKLGAEKVSIPQAYRTLCAYVRQYMEPEKVFTKDGYGHIESSYLPIVLTKLELGYERLELYKNFKLWGLLRTNGEGAGHPYTYKVGRNWYMAFPLAEDMGEKGGDQA